jgi:hypothetical protein
VQGGQCLVAWLKVTRPTDLGGLGIYVELNHARVRAQASVRVVGAH